MKILSMDRCLAAWFCLFGLIHTQANSQDKPWVVPLWQDSPPEWEAPIEQERDITTERDRLIAGKPVIRLGFVSRPELHIYKASGRNRETVVLICPGGGYNILAWDLEGTEIAKWLQGLGVTAIVVKYRVPTSRQPEKWLAPVQDIQRSLSLVRDGAIEGVDPKQIGVLGFSAGGNAVARVAVADQRYYSPTDEHDRASFLPDFGVLVYPAWLVDPDDDSRLAKELKVTDDTPPLFFAHAFDDRVTCMSSVALFSELRRHNIPSAIHIFSSGGHGFGARRAGQPTDAWPSLCESWMQQQGWLE